ncbi:glutathione S-transferase, partial [Pseudomonas syringae pv. tagetis]
IQMSFVGEFAKAQGMLQPNPNVTAWVETLQSGPAYRKAQEKGGEYSFAR